MYNKPLSIDFEVTDSCNNSCSHCYATDWMNMMGDSKHDILEVMRTLGDAEIFDINITGGEPLLLGVKKLTKIIDFLSSRNIALSLNTNGRLLDEEMCNELRSHGLDSMLISLHSWDDDLHDQIVNSFGAAQETKKGIVQALASGLYVTVNQVIDKRNIHSMLKTAIQLEWLGVSAVAITRYIPPLHIINSVEPVDPVAFLDKYLECREYLDIPCTSLLPFCYCSDNRIESIGSKLTCTGGIYTAAVSCTGDMRMCPPDSKVWGNILEEDIEMIWARIVKWRSGIGVPDHCKECSYLRDCMGGCRVDAAYHEGTYEGMDSWARKPIKNLIRKTIYYKMNPNMLHYLYPNLRYRKESNGYLVYGNNNSIIVNHDGLEFVKNLPKQFIPNNLIKKGGRNGEMIKAYLVDLHKNLLIT